MSNEVVSVVLVPGQGQLNSFYELSKKIPGSLFNLDKNHIPHVTILQFVAPFSALPKLEEDTKGLKRRISIDIGGLNFVPDIKRETTWVELTVLKSETLFELQQKILNTQFAKDFSLQNWGVGDTYRPHITLGVLRGTDNFPQVFLGESLSMLRDSLDVDVAVGRNGEYFSFAG